MASRSAKSRCPTSCPDAAEPFMPTPIPKPPRVEEVLAAVREQKLRLARKRAAAEVVAWAAAGRRRGREETGSGGDGV
jgi:hypothetical protein